MMTKNQDEKEVRTEAVLTRNPLFKGLETFYINDIIARGEVKTWPPGSQVIIEGESGDAVYFIISGRVKVTLYGEEGREIVLSILNEGDMFGEMSIIDDKPRSANVEVIKGLECLVVNKSSFIDYMSTHHKVYMRFFAYLTGRLREATRQIGGLALLDVCGRIAHTLIGMAKEGSATKEKVVTIERPTHEELAAMIGSSREVVSRALKKMTQDGYIKIEKGRILLYME
ncbi:MAG: Crp/Fnr family transcriptional regulator [Deltaproteobacteria bacterium]|nr:Crp/Fnr family transcriptional regulator [Deltaproteobacteria bacterium]